MNTVYSDIKKSAVRARLIPGIACIIIGLLVTIFLNVHLFTYIFSTKPDVFSIPSTEYKKGKWYSCENNLLYGYYASDSDGRYYLTATADGKYMGFYVYNKDVETAESITDDTYSYLDGETKDFSQLYLTGKGYIDEMDNTEKRYFKNYFEYDGASIEDYDVCYYTFRLTSFGNLLLKDNGHAHPVYMIIGILIMVVGVYFIVQIFTGGYKKDFEKSLATYGIRKEAMEQDMTYARKFENVYLSTRYMFTTGMTSAVYPFSAIVWAYVLQTNTQHKIYGVIPAGTTVSYQIVFWDRNKRKISFNVKNDDVAHTILQEMNSRAPYIIYGFSDELARATDSGEFNSLVATVDQRRTEYEQHNLDMTSGVMNYNQEDTQTPWYSSTSQDIYGNSANPQDYYGNSTNPQDPYGNSPM